MSGGKAYVGGTAYEITGGKTLIGGTAYDITAGKTLVGGTAYDISFGAAPPAVTLRNLLLDMTLIADSSYNSSTAISNPTSIVTANLGKFSELPLHYVISCYSGYATFYKPTTSGGAVTMSVLKQGNTAVGLAQAAADKNNMKYNYLHTTYENVYGASLLVVKFPNFAEADIDSLLSGMTLTRLAGRSASSTGNVRTTNKTHDFYITTRWKGNSGGQGGPSADTGFVIWECDGTQYSELHQVTPNYHPGAISGNYLTLSSTYSGSIFALDE